MTQMPYEPDLLTALGIVLREVDTLEVATGVVPIQVQHPMQLAQRALTLSLIGDGRFILGLGMSHRVVTEQMWGISFDKPVRRMREYLDGLLPLLAGEPADAVGETVSTRGALQIPGAPTPNVYIAAMGPQMLRLAGRRSAGTVTWMTGPKTLAEHVGPTLREAAAEAGRADGRGAGGGGATGQRHRRRQRARGRRPPNSSRCTPICRRIARCWTARVSPDPRTPRSSATSRPWRIVSTN